MPYFILFCLRPNFDFLLLSFPFSFGSPLFSCHLIYLPPLPHLCYSGCKGSVYAEQKQVSGLEQANGEILKAITKFPGNLF